MPGDDDESDRFRGGPTDPIPLFPDRTPTPHELLAHEVAGHGRELGRLDERHAALKERVDKSETRRWQLVGILITAALAAFTGSRFLFRLEGRVVALEQRLDRRDHRDRPADPFPLLPSWVLPTPPLVGIAEGPEL